MWPLLGHFVSPAVEGLPIHAQNSRGVGEIPPGMREDPGQISPLQLRQIGKITGQILSFQRFFGNWNHQIARVDHRVDRERQRSLDPGKE